MEAAKKSRRSHWPDFVRQSRSDGKRQKQAAHRQAPLPTPGPPAVPPADFASQSGGRWRAAKGAPESASPRPHQVSPPIAPADFTQNGAATSGGYEKARHQARPSDCPCPVRATPSPVQSGSSALRLQYLQRLRCPPAFLPTGSAIPGAAGPTSVECGAPLAIPPPIWRQHRLTVLPLPQLAGHHPRQSGACLSHRWTKPSAECHAHGWHWLANSRARFLQWPVNQHRLPVWL